MISLCALQIETSEDAPELSDDINFNCGHRSLEYCLENLTMSTQLPKPVRSQSLRERSRGNRKMSDVTIETYTDFETVTETGTTSSSKETSPSIGQVSYQRLVLKNWLLGGAVKRVCFYCQLFTFC